jgi:antitoxin component YwqK of YwqJK toxin-antitoxin module
VRAALASSLAFAAGLALTLAGCRREGPQKIPQGYLFEKGPYQGFYDPNGRLTRLLYDQNGDKKADVVILFYPSGVVKQVEADTNYDGIVDRWQSYNEQGQLEKEGYSRRGGKTADTWEYYDKTGAVIRRELDEDGTGKVDRVEMFQKGQLVAVGLDTDRDGKIERWQTWTSGRLVSEELDIDGDGIADRRLRYGPGGTVTGVDVLTHPRQAAQATPRTPAP